MKPFKTLFRNTYFSHSLPLKTIYNGIYINWMDKQFQIHYFSKSNLYEHQRASKFVGLIMKSYYSGHSLSENSQGK